MLPPKGNTPLYPRALVSPCEPLRALVNPCVSCLCESSVCPDPPDFLQTPSRPPPDPLQTQIERGAPPRQVRLEEFMRRSSRDFRRVRDKLAKSILVEQSTMEENRLLKEEVARAAAEASSPLSRFQVFRSVVRSVSPAPCICSCRAGVQCGRGGMPPEGAYIRHRG
eukprot:1013863-Prorocentrum_minimum.AAC.2